MNVSVDILCFDVIFPFSKSWGFVFVNNQHIFAVEHVMMVDFCMVLLGVSVHSQSKALGCLKSGLRVHLHTAAVHSMSVSANPSLSASPANPLKHELKL